MAVWLHLEKKYLPSLKPERYHQKDQYVTRFSPTVEENKLKEFWDLYKDERLSENEVITLLSTYDKVVIAKNRIEKLLEAYRSFEGDTNLPEQAKMIEKHYKANDDLIAIAFNQTSVAGDNWFNWGYDEENDQPIPYNLFEEDDHSLIGKIIEY